MCKTCKIMNLTGKVKNSDGTAVTEAQKMKFLHEDGVHTEGPFETDTDGGYSHALPLPGNWDVRVNGSPATPASIYVEVPAGWCTRHFKLA